MMKIQHRRCKIWRHGCGSGLDRIRIQRSPKNRIQMKKFRIKKKSYSVVMRILIRSKPEGWIWILIRFFIIWSFSILVKFNPYMSLCEGLQIIKVISRFYVEMDPYTTFWKVEFKSIFFRFGTGSSLNPEAQPCVEAPDPLSLLPAPQLCVEGMQIMRVAVGFSWGSEPDKIKWFLFF